MDKVTLLEEYKDVIIKRNDIKRRIQSPDVYCKMELEYLHIQLNGLTMIMREMEGFITVTNK